MRKLRAGLCGLALCVVVFGSIWPMTRRIDETYQTVCSNHSDWKEVKIDGEVEYNAVNLILKYGQMKFTGTVTVGGRKVEITSENRLPVIPPKRERPSQYMFFLIEDNVGSELAKLIGDDYIAGEYDKDTQNITLSYRDAQGNSQGIDLYRCA